MFQKEFVGNLQGVIGDRGSICMRDIKLQLHSCLFCVG